MADNSSSLVTPSNPRESVMVKLNVCLERNMGEQTHRELEECKKMVMEYVRDESMRLFGITNGELDEMSPEEFAELTRIVEGRVRRSLIPAKVIYFGVPIVGWFLYLVDLRSGALNSRFKFLQRLRKLRRAYGKGITAPTASSVVDRIPAEVLELIARINRRYTDLDLNSGEFLDLSEQAKLALLIIKINEDPDLARLNQLSFIGAIYCFWSENMLGGGMGKSLCFGNGGLYIYEWNEYEEGRRQETKATAALLDNNRVSYADLRRMIVDYTDRDTFVKHAAEFKKF